MGGGGVATKSAMLFPAFLETNLFLGWGVGYSRGNCRDGRGVGC